MRGNKVTRLAYRPAEQKKIADRGEFIRAFDIIWSFTGTLDHKLGRLAKQLEQLYVF